MSKGFTERTTAAIQPELKAVHILSLEMHLGAVLTSCFRWMPIMGIAEVKVVLPYLFTLRTVEMDRIMLSKQSGTATFSPLQPSRLWGLFYVYSLLVSLRQEGKQVEWLVEVHARRYFYDIRK